MAWQVTILPPHNNPSVCDSGMLMLIAEDEFAPPVRPLVAELIYFVIVRCYPGFIDTWTASVPEAGLTGVVAAIALQAA